MSLQMAQNFSSGTRTRATVRALRAARAGTPVLAMLLGACSMLTPTPDRGVGIEQLDTEPLPAEEVAMPAGPGNLRAVGPVVEVARGTAGGEPFGITAYRTADGACIYIEREMSGGGGCGALPGEGLPGFGPFGMLGSGGGGGLLEVSGLVISEAATVRIVLADGSHVPAALIPLEAADIDASLFVAFLSEHPAVQSVVAVGADGTELGHFDFMPTGPAGPPGIAPTPEHRNRIGSPHMSSGWTGSSRSCSAAREADAHSIISRGVGQIATEERTCPPAGRSGW